MGRKGIKISCLTAFYLTLLVQGNPAIAQQDPNAEWVIRQILDDTLHHNPYLSQWVPPARMLYWPEDMGYSNEYYGGSFDPLVRIKNKLLYVVETTGRVYEIGKRGDGLSFKRLDETIFSGYNSGAYTFDFRDTIWSYGGYGFWQANGHLRYFSEGSKGWEIMPVNTKVQHYSAISNNYLDLQHAKLFVVAEPLLDDGIRKAKPSGSPRMDTTKLMVLDMNTKNWSVAGILNEGPLTMILNPVTTNLPWGKLFIMGPKSDFRTLCMDFYNNKLLVIRKKELGTLIYESFFPGRNSLKPPHRTLNYYHNDTLHIINSKKDHIRIHLTREDFTETGQEVYRQVEEPAFSMMFWAWLALGTGMISLVAGTVLTIRSHRLIKEVQSGGDLNGQEKELLQALLTAGTEFLSTDSVDTILVPQGKSPDSIKKKRSAAIRSINEKYSEVSGDPEPLIVTARMESDRRMLRYGISAEKSAKAKRLLL